MGALSVTVDGLPVVVAAGSTILDAADAAGVYVPRLCSHPSLRTRGRCGVCAVETAAAGVVRACETEVAEGMEVRTGTEAARAARAVALCGLLARHPHVCLTCDLREGCSRTECSYGVAENQRCCEKLGACELQKVAAFAGIPDDAPAYEPRDFPTAHEILFTRNPNLCIGCLRCEDACRDIAKAEAVSRVVCGELVLAGPATGETMKEAGCVFCGACVQVCPTGALMPEKGDKGSRWAAKTRAKLGLKPVPEPPRRVLRLDGESLARVPAAEGVYQLCDAEGKVLRIKGVLNLREALAEELDRGAAASFVYEEDPMYTARETQLIQQHIARYGSMPGDDELEELF